MLIPRVTAALVKFLSPVANSANNALDLGRNTVRELSRELKKKKDQPPQQQLTDQSQQEQSQQHPQQEDPKLPLLNLVTPLPTEEHANSPDSSTQMDPTPTTKPSAVIQLFSYFLKNKNPQAKTKVQATSYGTAIKTQKHSVRFKKGTILDTKAE